MSDPHPLNWSRARTTAGHTINPSTAASPAIAPKPPARAQQRRRQAADETKSAPRERRRQPSPRAERPPRSRRLERRARPFPGSTRPRMRWTRLRRFTPDLERVNDSGVQAPGGPCRALVDQGHDDRDDDRPQQQAAEQQAAQHEPRGHMPLGLLIHKRQPPNVHGDANQAIASGRKGSVVFRRSNTDAVRQAHETEGPDDHP